MVDFTLVCKNRWANCWHFISLTLGRNTSLASDHWAFQGHPLVIKTKPEMTILLENALDEAGWIINESWPCLQVFSSILCDRTGVTPSLLWPIECGKHVCDWIVGWMNTFLEGTSFLLEKNDKLWLPRLRYLAFSQKWTEPVYSRKRADSILLLKIEFKFSSKSENCRKPVSIPLSLAASQYLKDFFGERCGGIDTFFWRGVMKYARFRKTCLTQSFPVFPECPGHGVALSCMGAVPSKCEISQWILLQVQNVYWYAFRCHIATNP